MGAGAQREPNINQISLIEILPHTFIDKNLSPLITNLNLKISIKCFNSFGKNLIMCASPSIIVPWSRVCLNTNHYQRLCCTEDWCLLTSNCVCSDVTITHHVGRCSLRFESVHLSAFNSKIVQCWHIWMFEDVWSHHPWSSVTDYNFLCLVGGRDTRHTVSPEYRTSPPSLPTQQWPQREPSVSTQSLEIVGCWLVTAGGSEKAWRI